MIDPNEIAAFIRATTNWRYLLNLKVNIDERLVALGQNPAQPADSPVKNMHPDPHEPGRDRPRVAAVVLPSAADVTAAGDPEPIRIAGQDTGVASAWGVPRPPTTEGTADEAQSDPGDVQPPPGE